ncbi:MAG TPA: heme o synthase [Vicinamibacterales bacterium]|nr:heme o synthase [Vicinamibacterales bacterium]
MKEAAATREAAPAASHVFSDYLALTKPRLNFLVVASSAAGYYLGAPAVIDLSSMVQAVIGTALVAGGAAALNQVAERDTDGLMRRTRMRPLPDGRITPADARIFGFILSVAGLALLMARSNVLAALLALATLAVYLAIYTPMKRRTSLATLLGAVPGALPPVIGWTAAHGSIDRGGAALFALVFLWQIPHFMAIAWLYRDDYGLAGFPMLPVIDPHGRRAARQAVFYAAMLIPVSVLPSLVGIAGSIYLWTAIVLGLGLAWLAIRFLQTRSDASARALFFGSITYLPLIWIVMVVNKQ